MDSDLVCTEHPVHAPELTDRVVSDGYKSVDSVSGDGTAYEGPNRLILAKIDGTDIGVFEGMVVYRGNDLAFKMGVPSELKMDHRIFLQGDGRKVDI